MASVTRVTFDSAIFTATLSADRELRKQALEQASARDSAKATASKQLRSEPQREAKLQDMKTTAKADQRGNYINPIILNILLVNSFNKLTLYTSLITLTYTVTREQGMSFVYTLSRYSYSV
jgi:hypothetical protein